MTEYVALEASGTVPLTVHEWFSRDLPEPDFLMGHLLSTTSRFVLVAPTGLGKTNFMLALTAHIAANMPFLHWPSGHRGRQRRVLFVDGEMSTRLMQRRLKDALRRLGMEPPGLHVLSFEDLDNPQPLNTPGGQAIIEDQIARIGGVDFIAFDNVMALIGGDMKEEEGWKQALPWVRSLTRRRIGQAWVHHTGHDVTRGYGTKTREWQMDTVAFLEALERSDTDVSFNLTFRKARERTPENRAEFQDVKVALVNDAWTYELSETAAPKGRVSPLGRRFMDAFMNALANDSVTTFQGWRAVTMDAWRDECITMGLIDKQAKPASARSMFSKYRAELVAAQLVSCHGDLAWKI